MEVLHALRDGFGHLLCGVYVQVTRGGELVAGDEMELAA
jgi:MOSC domain-containing protein YiiM